MYKKHFIGLIIVTGFILTQVTVNAQEFPIAVGSDSTFSFSGAFDGTNYLVPIMGNNVSQYSNTAQLISQTGNLIGSRIPVGGFGIFAAAGVAFDGSNYLQVWIENNGDVKGQFISPSGNLVGSHITIATNALSIHQSPNMVVFSDPNYFVIFIKGDGSLYGQRINKNGSLIGDQIKINSLILFARDPSLAYDGTNYLVVWVEDGAGVNDYFIYGQLISKTGELVGPNFLIDGGGELSDNPTSTAFVGTGYVVAFHEQSLDSKWNLFARFVGTNGTVEPERFTICDSTKDPFIPFLAFDGNNVLVTWAQGSNLSLMGRFFNNSGVPIDTPFVIFNSLDNKLPIGGSIYGGNKFLAVATRVNSNFTDGDVYGKFIQQITGVEDESDLIPEKFVLSQNYPNPFNSTSKIKYSIPKLSQVLLKIFNTLGSEIETLVNEEKPVGTYELNWNAAKLPSGVYFYRLQAGDFVQTRKMILMK